MHKGRVLVVDDEANARTALAELLKEEGYTVETAADGFKALGKLEDFTPGRPLVKPSVRRTPAVKGMPRSRWLAALGVRYPKDKEEEFVVELRDVYYRYYGASLSEIDPLKVIREAFQLIYAMNLRLPSRYLLLDRAIATVGSVGIELYPDFNVFEVARPYARSLLLERFTSLVPWPVTFIDPAPAIARRVSDLRGPAASGSPPSPTRIVFTSGIAPSPTLAAALARFGIN